MPARFTLRTPAESTENVSKCVFSKAMHSAVRCGICRYLTHEADEVIA